MGKFFLIVRPVGRSSQVYTFSDIISQTYRRGGTRGGRYIEQVNPAVTVILIRQLTEKNLHVPRPYEQLQMLRPSADGLSMTGFPLRLRAARESW